MKRIVKIAVSGAYLRKKFQLRAQRASFSVCDVGESASRFPHPRFVHPSVRSSWQSDKSRITTERRAMEEGRKGGREEGRKGGREEEEGREGKGQTKKEEEEKIEKGERGGEGGRERRGELRCAMQERKNDRKRGDSSQSSSRRRQHSSMRPTDGRTQARLTVARKRETSTTMPLNSGGGGGNLFYTLWLRYGSNKSGAPRQRLHGSDGTHGRTDEFEFLDFRFWRLLGRPSKYRRYFSSLPFPRECGRKKWRQSIENGVASSGRRKSIE